MTKGEREYLATATDGGIYGALVRSALAHIDEMERERDFASQLVEKKQVALDVLGNERAALRAKIAEAVEWAKMAGGGDGREECIECGKIRHSPDCRLAARLKEVRND